LTSPILDGLNDAQRSAVTAPDGPVLVLAGPGSGKTRVLTRRIAWLIQERGVPPWRIMAVTFTNKAAREMRQRVENLLGEDLKGLSLGTFHATCARLLRREADFHPLTREYVIYDAADQRALIKDVIVGDLDLDEKRVQPNRVLAAISALKDEMITPDQYQPQVYRDEIVKRVYARYQERLLANNAVDFDDLLMRTAMLFDEHPDVLARYQRNTGHVLIDEFQDTNLVQYRLARQLSGGEGNLFCVGDEDQSIYRWRGADYRNVLRLRDDYPTLHTVLLERNYRSTQLILDAAQAVIDKNPHRTRKNLVTDRAGGPEIVVFEAFDEEEESRFVVDTIASLVATDGIEPGECAVMYRTNAQSRALEEAFVRAGLPYRLVGATRFYTRREIKDLIAYLRIIHNPEDGVSLLRVLNTPPRGIGSKTLDTLMAWAGKRDLSLYGALTALAADPDSAPFGGRARNALVGFAGLLEGWRGVQEKRPLGELIRLVLDEVGYREYVDDGTEQGADRWANVMELVNVAAEYPAEVPLSAFLEEVALVSDVDNLAEEVNAPTLLTLHAAKGLEYDVVFMVGLEDDVLPHARSQDDPEQMAEERRLMYVGMTRARQRLYLTYAFQRLIWGSTELKMRSRFVDDIPADLVLSARPDGSAYRRATTWGGPSGRTPPRITTPEESSQLAQHFKAGQRVLHAKFGEGIVIESRPSGADEEVSVAFEEAGLKRLIVSFANLTLLEG
jgi:DNA helicase-2/ATP-dependent DNA helicase PcrA